MRNLLAFAAFLVVAFLGIGWYLGWYQITSQTTGDDGHSRWSIDVNTKKVGADVSKGVQAVQDRIKGSTGGTTSTPTNTNPPTGNNSSSNGSQQVFPPPPLNNPKPGTGR